MLGKPRLACCFRLGSQTPPPQGTPLFWIKPRTLALVPDLPCLPRLHLSDKVLCCLDASRLRSNHIPVSLPVFPFLPHSFYPECHPSSSSSSRLPPPPSPFPPLLPLPPRPITYTVCPFQRAFYSSSHPSNRGSQGDHLHLL